MGGLCSQYVLGIVDEADFASDCIANFIHYFFKRAPLPNTGSCVPSLVILEGTTANFVRLEPISCPLFDTLGAIRSEPYARASDVNLEMYK